MPHDHEVSGLQPPCWHSCLFPSFSDTLVTFITEVIFSFKFKYKWDIVSRRNWQLSLVQDIRDKKKKITTSLEPGTNYPVLPPWELHRLRMHTPSAQCLKMPQKTHSIICTHSPPPWILGHSLPSRAQFFRPGASGIHSTGMSPSAGLLWFSWYTFPFLFSQQSYQLSLKLLSTQAHYLAFNVFLSSVYILQVRTSNTDHRKRF